MRSVFPGFPEEGMAFLRGLARHNNRDWFLPRKAVFDEQVKQPMRELVEALNGSMRKYAPDYVTEPEKAIFRFYRDTRFSKDKTPYKEHIAASFNRRGMARHQGAGYYCAISHKNVAMGGGIYMPVPESLLAVRNHIAEHASEFRKILKGRTVNELYGEMQGESLTRVPKGFCAEHPAADLIRRKQYFYYLELPPEIATTPAVYTEIDKRFRAIAPFVEFLNAPLKVARKIEPKDLFF